MNKITKAASMVALSVILMLPTTASAETWKVNNEAHTFTQAWEEIAGSPATGFGFIYGYNTFLINEDYCHSISNTTHYSAITNPTSHTSNTATAGKWANCDVRHQNTAIYYGMVY